MNKKKNTETTTPITKQKFTHIRDIDHTLARTHAHLHSSSGDRYITTDERNL